MLHMAGSYPSIQLESNLDGTASGSNNVMIEFNHSVPNGSRWQIGSKSPTVASVEKSNQFFLWNASDSLMYLQCSKEGAVQTVRIGHNQNQSGTAKLFLPGDTWISPVFSGNNAIITAGRENLLSSTNLQFRTFNNGTVNTPLTLKSSGAVRYTPMSSSPISGVQEGDIYYDSTLKKLRCYDGTAWQNCW